MNLATTQERYSFVNFHGLRLTFPTTHIQIVIFNVCFYQDYTLLHIMLVIIIILYPFAYNNQQKQNTTTHKPH